MLRIDFCPARCRLLARAGVLALVLAIVGARDVIAQPQASAVRAVLPVTVTLVHLNDVYEVLPVEGGKSGGLARVATAVRQLNNARSPVVVTLGGDYLSPSALGTAIVDGQPLAGRQMVDVLNAVGLDWATFGNHEFDVSEAAFRAHLAQAKFRIVSSNVTDAAGQPFPGVPTSAVVPVKVAGRTVRIGLVGVTIDANRKSWLRYRDGIAAAKEAVGKLRGKVDAIVALTHLSLAQDAELVEAVPGIDLVLGGHEHENWIVYRGPFVPIVKADANVRSLAIVTLSFTAPGARPRIAARLQPIDDTIASDPAVDAVAKRWVERAFEAFRRQGFAPEAVVANTTEPLDGRESTVRNRPGRLTDVIAEAIAREGGDVDVAMFNAGSIRIDDVLPPGPVTEYDVIRVLPFGGTLVKASFDGELLARVLDTGVNNEGTGGYLQTFGVRRDNGTWLVRGKPIDPARRYAVALLDFLLTGRETNFGFLTRTNPQVHDVVELREMRRVVIEQLARAYPGK
ncbi:MAG: bifunctional metallophosphatase/5'-nucleotidase [Burkholderiales bacterium]|nr:bifunctional metallophosphatase/5'-nucleotidase [Burkholderiales bacterium]